MLGAGMGVGGKDGAVLSISGSEEEEWVCPMYRKHGEVACGESGARRNWGLPLFLPSYPTSSPFPLSLPRQERGVGKASWGRRHLKESPTECLPPPFECHLFLPAFRVFCSSVAPKPSRSPLKCRVPRLGDPGACPALHFPDCAPSFTYLTSVGHVSCASPGVPP